MRVYNLTNTPTPVLESVGLVDVPVEVDGIRVAPGCSAPVPRRGLSAKAGRLLRLGAIHVGSKPPAGFKAAEGESEPAPAPAPAPAPRRTLAVSSRVTPTDSVAVSSSDDDDEESDED